MNRLSHIIAFKLTAGVLLLASFSIAQDDQLRWTCQNITCAADEVCRMIDVQCFRAPCYPVPTCFPVCSPLTDCSLNCSNGHVKSYGGCDTCECRVCGPDPCPGMICFYGKAKDADGCLLCPCHDPCMDVECPSDTQCHVERRNSTSSEYYGRCVAIVTSPPCPQVRCSSQCRFGFKHDNNGCQTCQCYDPCEGYQCPTGKHCVMTADDCPPGAECRDSPMKYCADSNDSSLLSPSTTTFKVIGSTAAATGSTTFEKPGRGESSLMQCCIGAGITDVCLPFCTTNITQLYQNYESMTGCYQYLGKFLSCSSGGRSFETCCRSRGISETCVYLCSGDDEVDMTNNHQVTQCILTSSQTVIDCFNSGVPDVDITATSSTTPSTTSAANFCLLGPDPGPCDGNVERWYFSATARSCSTFRYGGCEGNGNSFATRDACLSRCGAPGSICPDVMCAPSCQIVVDQAGCHVCSCVTDCFTQGCPANHQCTMMPGDCANGTNCPLVPRCIPPPDLICEVLNCTLSCTNGWMTDSRGCVVCQCRRCDVTCTEDPTCPYGRAKGSDGCDTCACYEPCQGMNCAAGHCSVVRDDPTGPYIGRCIDSSSTTFALPTERPTYCHLAADYGLSCTPNSTRWYYDPSTDVCSAFQFGGCLGNDNNFQSKDRCEAVCHRGGGGGGGGVTCLPPVCDPLPVCEYGPRTDADGCMTCRCIDPCDGVVCPGGTTCTGRRCSDALTCRQPYTHECIDTTSAATTTAVRGSRGCGQFMCLMYCPAGFAQDSNGCDTCNCRDPCQNCTANQTCITMSVDCPPSASPCPYSLVGYCVDKAVSTSPTTPSVTASPIESTTAFRCLLCMMRCTYGMLKDARGCPVCRCYDPCQNLNCPRNASCLVTDMCPSNDACTPDVRYKGRCPSVTPTLTTQAISSKSPGGRTTPCIVCMIYCEYGMQMGTNGCPLCQCKNPCKNVSCAIGERCQPVAQANGDFIGLCIVTTLAPAISSASVRATSAGIGCPGASACERLCAYNYGKYSNGCRSCQCRDPCQTTTCDLSTTCVRVPSVPDCEDGLCWLTYKGVCSGGCQAPICQLSCPYGLALGDNGCPYCDCHDPCKGFVCQDGYQCRVQNVYFCTSGSSCSDIPTGYCEIAHPSTSGCNVSCLYGFAKDASGQTICQCLDPCEGVVCEAAKTCIASDHAITDENPIGYSYRGRCAECTQTMTCKMFCRYGFAKDTDGCDVCGCYDPCKDVSCLARQTCIVSEQFNGKYNYVAVCTPALSATTIPGGPSTTAIPCPMPMCSGPACIYGLATDANGCIDCSCSPDPCKDHQCSNSDEVCRAILYCPFFNCSSSSQTVCIDKTRPCEALQMEYARIYSGNIAKMPQLNCDSSGRFKVTQCHDGACWCVDGQTGTEATNKSDMSINCYNGNKILSETVIIDADFDVIKPEDGWKFKQQLSMQMANMLSVDEALVTVMTYGRGSIIAKLAFATDLMWTESSTEQRLNDLKPQTFDIRYDNKTYNARFSNGLPEPSTTGFPQPPFSDFPPVETSPPSELTAPPSFRVASGLGSNMLLVIILICVFVPIAFVAVAATAWLACKTYRGQRMIPVKPLKSGTSTEVTSLESGSEKNYSNDYKEPTSPTHDTTEA